MPSFMLINARSLTQRIDELVILTLLILLQSLKRGFRRRLVQEHLTFAILLFLAIPVVIREGVELPFILETSFKYNLLLKSPSQMNLRLFGLGYVVGVYLEQLVVLFTTPLPPHTKL